MILEFSRDWMPCPHIQQVDSAREVVWVGTGSFFMWLLNELCVFFPVDLSRYCLGQNETGSLSLYQFKVGPWDVRQISPRLKKIAVDNVQSRYCACIYLRICYR